MVFLSLISLARSRGPDEFWRKRKIFKLAAHFLGRRRNCYSLAIRAVHRSLWYSTQGRKLKKEDMHELWVKRITAGTEQHGLSTPLFLEGLMRSNILINKKTLADLAAWEPRTFKSLTDIARARVKQDNVKGTNSFEFPSNVIVQGRIQ